MYLKRRKISQRIGEGILTGILIISSMVSIGLFVGIAFFLIKNGMTGLSLSFLTMNSDILKDKTGILEYLVNTLILLSVTLPLAGTVGVLGAVYLCEYAKNKRLTDKINLAIEILAGIPSVVFGLFGMVFFGEVLHLGYSLLTGALTLSIMVLPIILENTKEALKKIPLEYKQAALGLGAGKWHMTKTILLPQSISGIGAGVTLSAGKLLGDSAALLLTAGSKGSLSVALYMMIGKGKFAESYSIALLLLILMLCLNLLIQYFKGDKYLTSLKK